jgi:hypothetical protein
MRRSDTYFSRAVGVGHKGLELAASLTAFGTSSLLSNEEARLGGKLIRFTRAYPTTPADFWRLYSRSISLRVQNIPREVVLVHRTSWRPTRTQNLSSVLSIRLLRGRAGFLYPTSIAVWSATTFRIAIHTDILYGPNGYHCGHERLLIVICYTLMFKINRKYIVICSSQNRI